MEQNIFLYLSGFFAYLITLFSLFARDHININAIFLVNIIFIVWLPLTLFIEV